MYTDVYSLTDLLDVWGDEDRASRVCTCGHTRAAHDEEEDPSPCGANGCECEAFTEDPRGMHG